MGAVGLVFAPLAPLVVVAAAIVFWMSSCVYKYQLMFVFVSKVESGGVRIFLPLYQCLLLTIPVFLQRIWNVVINRLLFCVLLMQALMILSEFYSRIVSRPICLPFLFSNWTSVRIPHITMALCGSAYFYHFSLQDLH
jgi:calcium permeable stress-gated cation channel